MSNTAMATYTDELGVLGRKKTELQANGIIVPTALQDELERGWNAPALKRGRFVFLLEQPATGLFTTVLIINGRFSEKSPFHIVKSGPDRYEIWKNDEKFTDIAIMPRPDYYDMTTSDGVPMSDVAVIGEHKGQIAVLGDHHINRYTTGFECCFKVNFNSGKDPGCSCQHGYQYQD